MLNFEQIKAIENALGAEKAGPIIQAFEVMEERSKDGMATRQDIAELKRDLEYAKLELQATIHALKAETIKWVAGMLVAQAALIAALVKLL